MLRKLIEKYYLWRYKNFGIRYGEFISCSYMVDTPLWVERTFTKIENKIERLGFTPLDFVCFIECGGYGHPLPPIKKSSRYDI
jgi:hypothetical protein